METTLKISKKKHTEYYVLEVLNNFMELVGISKRDMGWHVKVYENKKYFIIKFTFKEDYDEHYEHEEE